MPLILASSSPIRRQLLTAAGVAFESVSPDIDEAAFKAGRTDPSDIASGLAEAKALAVGGGDWTIGSDSVASVEGRLFDKPASRAEAVEHLRYFSGRVLRLTSAVALARLGEIDWHHSASAILQVRTLSDAFIQSYLEAEWPEVGYCVGVFRMEGRGVQLFSEIDGDHFTILGLPLIPLLDALRERGLLEA